MRAFAEATTDHRLLLDTIVRRTAELMGGFCAIALVSDDGQWLNPAAVFDPDSRRLALVRLLFATAPIPVKSPHPTSHVLETGESFLMPQIDPEQLRARF